MSTEHVHTFLDGTGQCSCGAALVQAEPTVAAVKAEADPLVARLTPQRDMLLVRRDPRVRQLAGGLWAPDNAGELNTVRAGTVLKAGPDAPHEYDGARIAFYAMTVLQDESESSAHNGGDGTTGAGAIGLVPSTEVLCTFAADEETLPVPLDVSGVAYARAPRGGLLVERSTIPNGRGGVLMPGTYVGSVRSLEATVIDVHSSVCKFVNTLANGEGTKLVTERRQLYAAGIIVLLASSAGRNVNFGLTGDRVLSVIAPSQILCVVSEPLQRDVEPSSDLRDYIAGSTPRPPSDVKWDEGDRRAPR